MGRIWGIIMRRYHEMDSDIGEVLPRHFSAARVAVVVLETTALVAVSCCDVDSMDVKVPE
jgi:hypothetical protein